MFASGCVELTAEPGSISLDESSDQSERVRARADNTPIGFLDPGDVPAEVLAEMHSDEPISPPQPLPIRRLPTPTEDPRSAYLAQLRGFAPLTLVVRTLEPIDFNEERSWRVEVLAESEAHFNLTADALGPAIIQLMIPPGLACQGQRGLDVGTTIMVHVMHAPAIDASNEYVWLSSLSDSTAVVPVLYRDDGGLVAAFPWGEESVSTVFANARRL